MNNNNLEHRFTQPAGWQWDSFTNDRKQSLRYGSLQTHKTPDAHIIFVEGLSEYAEKTFELARDVEKMNCNFWVADRHGQGKSGRFLKDIFKQHSTGFEEDVKDLTRMVKNILPDDGAPVILVGHSTGGLISLIALHDEPDTFDGAILTAPLFGIHNPLVKGREAIFARLPGAKWLLESYATGFGTWMPRTSPLSPLKQDDFTSDPARQKIHDYWQEKDPDLQIGGPTFGWLKNTCFSITKVRDKDYLAEIKQPVLLFTAGDDKLVVPQESFKVAAALPNATTKHFPNGKHELLMETDDIRKPLLQKSRRFIKKVRTP